MNYKLVAGWLVGILVGGYILTGAVSEWGEWHVRGEGKHVVFVTAVERDGIFWPTWTAYVKSDLESTQEDRYCVRPANDDLIPVLEKAAEDNARLEITYKVYLRVDWSECVSRWWCETSCEEGAIVAVRRV